MNDRRKTEIELARNEYIAAYLCAHPSTGLTSLSHISYENGWWCFRKLVDYRPAGKPFARYRTVDFELMTKRLLATRDTVKETRE